MVGGGRSTLKVRNQYVSALIPLSSTAKHEQFESGYGSENSASEDSPKHHQTKSQKHRQVPPTSTRNVHRPKSVMHDTHPRDSIERGNTKQQSSIGPTNNYHRLKTANSRISVDLAPLQKVIKTSNDLYSIFYTFITPF